jgi:hypothetical protein
VVVSAVSLAVAAILEGYPLLGRDDRRKRRSGRLRVNAEGRSMEIIAAPLCDRPVSYSSTR